MERSEFARLALEQIKKARPGEVSILDEDKFIVVSTNADAKSSITSLSNYFDEYNHAENEEKRKGVLDRIGRAARFIDGQEGLDEVRVMLVPRIRPRRYFEVDVARLAGELATKNEKTTKPISHYQPLAEYLGVGLAIDRPEHIEYVTNPSSYNVPVEELHAIALTNLKRMTKAPLEKVRDGLYAGNWGDEYASERMLLDDVWNGLELDGDPVVFLPGAECIFVVGSNDEASQVLALALVEERLSAPRGLLGFAFVRKNGTWELFAPRTEVGRELGKRLCHHIADTYAPQKEKLEAEFVEDDEAPFVASLMALGDQEGNLNLTLATWGADIYAYLPRAEVLGIGHLGGDTVMVPWDDVMELASQHLELVPDLFPPRWKTKGFPDDATFAELKKRAIELGKKKADADADSSRASEADDREARGRETRARLARQGAPRMETVPPASKQKLFLLLAVAVFVVIALVRVFAK